MTSRVEGNGVRVYERIAVTRTSNRYGRNNLTNICSQHRKTHLKPFECKTCKRRFALRADVSRHTRTQHQIVITKYFCEAPECTFKATRKDNLQQHRRRKHKLPVGSQLHQF